MAEPAPTDTVRPLLSVSGLVAGYGAAAVLHGVDLEVRRGEIVALLGSNGTGKTTTLSGIAGLLRPMAGTVRLHGDPVISVPVEQLVARGISLVQEGRHIVPLFTVEENLLLGAFLRKDAEIAADIARIHGIFPRLRERFRQPVDLLSGGEQQMLAIPER
jgi:branched-chain amino acid transport system ATP-binding protein